MPLFRGQVSDTTLLPSAYPISLPAALPAARGEAPTAPTEPQDRGSVPTLRPTMQTGPESAAPRTPDEATRVVERFQGLMAKFLDTQRTVMLAYLGQETRTGEPAADVAVTGEQVLQQRGPAPEPPIPDPLEQTISPEASSWSPGMTVT